MDCSKVGRLIFGLRKEKNMTQKELADAMDISDRTISKWERGIGCPDVSLLNGLSNILGVQIENMLSGGLDSKDSDGGNMKRVKFYVGPSCGNVLFGTGEVEISCCGRKLVSLHVKSEDVNHDIVVEKMEDGYYVTTKHEMSKSHFISFIAYVVCDRVVLIRLYPEQTVELRFPKMHGTQLYAYCNQYGLWEKKII